MVELVCPDCGSSSTSSIDVHDEIVHRVRFDPSRHGAESICIVRESPTGPYALRSAPGIIDRYTKDWRTIGFKCLGCGREWRGTPDDPAPIPFVPRGYTAPPAPQDGPGRDAGGPDGVRPVPPDRIYKGPASLRCRSGPIPALEGLCLLRAGHAGPHVLGTTVVGEVESRGVSGS